jgi:hypothetical protein
MLAEAWLIEQPVESYETFWIVLPSSLSKTLTVISSPQVGLT